jgi:hypothetical protein
MLVPISAFPRAVNQLKTNGAVGKKMGRPPAMDSEVVAELQAEIAEADAARNSKDKQQITKAIRDKRKEVAVRNDQNALAIKDTCAKTNMKYIKQIAPHVVNAPTPQSERRFDALQRPVNHVSMAAM